MNYRIFIDSKLTYDSALNDKKWQIFDTKLELELNKTNSFEFTIYPIHPMYSAMNKLKSIVEVYQNGDLVFKGRILNDEIGFYNEKKVICEGDLAFLLDSLQSPFEFPNGDISTSRQLFSYFINQHNLQVEEFKQFKLGNITIVDDTLETIKDDGYKNTWESINQYIIEKFGGYLWIRHENDGNYIDLLDDFSTICQQKIVFAENLVELAKTIKGEELYTSIIPIGSRTEGDEKKLTIKSVADFDDGEFIKRGDRLYHKEAVEKYGTIVRMVTWDKVDTTSRLLENAKIRLRKNVNIQTSIELSAADLASINADISSFKLGNYVRIKSKPHDIDDDYLIKKISLDLLTPSSNKLTIGASFSSFSENQSAIEKNISDLKQQTSDNADGLNLLNAQIKTLDGTVTTLGEATAQIIEKTTPSNWTNLVISDDYKPYDDLTENYPKFKKMNNIVCVRGILSPKESYTSSTTAVTIASGLPVECRPPKNLAFVCQGSGMNRWTLHITTSGDIKMNRYGISTPATVPTTAWLSFAICYSV